jgi:Mg2+-importing ATPase
MLPKQILLLNVLSDLPAMGLATDRVDEEMMTRPLKWNIGSLSRSMIAYGVVSSVFDYITFGSLLILGVSADVFRTGWFIESVLTEVLVLYVIRTRRPLWRSQAGTLLVSMSLLVSVLAILLPYSPLASPLGFTTLPLRYGLIVAIILVLYVSSSEIVKRYVNR